MSHGESFLAVLGTVSTARASTASTSRRRRCRSPRPSAWSPRWTGWSARPGALRDPLPRAGRDARGPILEVGPWGLRETAWEDLELVEHWRRYLDAPGRYLRHLLDD